MNLSKANRDLSVEKEGPLQYTIHSKGRVIMNALRLHLLGLAHLATNKSNTACAYTQKVVKLATMIRQYGHTLYFYGLEGSEVECSELIEVSTRGYYDRLMVIMTRAKSFSSTTRPTWPIGPLMRMQSKQFSNASSNGISSCVPWVIIRNR